MFGWPQESGAILINLGTHRRVSFDNELLIMVDDSDNVFGYETKAAAHVGKGLLHRAFSIFLFSNTGKLLLQQRSEEKPLWPEYWTNTCCSHPRKGESYMLAAERRLKEELGVRALLHPLYQFQYAEEFKRLGSERELCTVFIGKLSEREPVRANRSEVMDWKWVECEEIDRLAARSPELLTPWFLLEWEQLRIHRRAELDSILSADSVLQQYRKAV